MHRYRSHTCGALTIADVGQSVRLSGWVHRVRDHGGLLFIDLRDHYGMTQCVADPDSPAFGAAERVRSEWVIRIDGRVKARTPATVNAEPADRRGRGLHRRAGGSLRDRRTAHAGVRRSRLPGRDAAQVPLPRPAPRQAAPQRHEARGDHLLAAPAHDRFRLLRIPDADPYRLVAGGRPRLPGALAAPPGQVLRPAAGAAAVQAAHHDRRLRPLLPDRAVLPRRGRPRRPFAGRVLPARHRDELRRAGGRLPGGRAGAARPLRGVRRRQAGHPDLPAHPLCRGAEEIRLRQARPAQPHRDAGRHGAFRRLRLQGLRRPDRGRSQGRGVGDSGADRWQPRLLRPHERLGAGRGPAGPRLHLLPRRRRRCRADRQEHRRRPHRCDPQPARPVRRRRRLLRLRPAGQVLRLRRRRPPEGRPRPQPGRRGPLRLLLDRRFPDVRVERAGEEDRLLPQPVLHAELRPRRLPGARSRATRRRSSRSTPSSTTSSATASSCRPAPSAITSRRS